MAMVMSNNITYADQRNSLNSSGDISSTTDFIMPSVTIPQPTIRRTPKKRSVQHIEVDGEPPTKKSLKATIRVGTGFEWNLQAVQQAAAMVESGGKSPVSALNELGLTVTYTMVQQSGPAHCPNFVYAVNVANMKFEGFGHSKREARAAAARACIAALLARIGRVVPTHNQVHADFTSDEVEKANFKTQLDSLPKPVNSDAFMGPPGEYYYYQPFRRRYAPPPPPLPSSSRGAPAPLFGRTEPAAAGVPKSPINVLHECYPQLAFTCLYGDGTTLEDAQGPPVTLGHSMRYKVICHIKDAKFEGYGSSKKLAKLAAARSAMAALGVGDGACTPSDQDTPAPGYGLLPQILADHIGKLVNEKFNVIMKNDPIHSKRKVLAGIVITTNLSVEHARVIAVTTGTKCVCGEHMSVRGRVVNDCHAEVVARRCLQKHFYEQLLQYAQSNEPRKPIESSDLEPVGSGGYQLKPSRHIHLYVSTAPCGDGRIFSPHESADPADDKHPNRLARGQLRTKIESGEGTIPVKKSTNIVQTWDGVLQGERLLTMSCSDKVARWCVVGMQGALLSHLMKPVYLHCVVLGSLLHPRHMYRAMCGRIEKHLEPLPQDYTHRRPLVARAASTEARMPQRAPNHSVVWCAGAQQENAAEVLNATTGKLENGQPSLLCKQSMFARWQYLVTRLDPLAQVLDSNETPSTVPEKIESLLYSEAKQLSASYQAAKTALIEAFDRAQLGRWIKKPIEQDQFTCELTNADPSALFS